MEQKQLKSEQLFHHWSDLNNASKEIITLYVGTTDNDTVACSILSDAWVFLPTNSMEQSPSWETSWSRISVFHGTQTCVTMFTTVHH